MRNAPKRLSMGIKDGILYQYNMALRLEKFDFLDHRVPRDQEGEPVVECYTDQQTHVTTCIDSKEAVPLILIGTQNAYHQS